MNAHAPGVCDNDSTPLTPYEKYSPSQTAETVFLVEVRGVEPLSESTLTGTSPGADGCLHSLVPAGAVTLRDLVAS